MYNKYVLMPDGELYHYGIKNMKWGVRRYQNKDGSLTPAGIKRYNKEVQKLKDREASIKAREKAKTYQDKLDKKKSELDEREAALKGKSAAKKQTKPTDDKSGTSAPRKSIKDMSDKELQDFVDRVALEKKYRDALASTLPPKKVSKGRQFVDFALSKMIIPAAEDAGKAAAKKIFNSIMDSAIESMEKKKDDK